jgi:hypothetical protein
MGTTMHPFRWTPDVKFTAQRQEAFDPDGVTLCRDCLRDLAREAFDTRGGAPDVRTDAD